VEHALNNVATIRKIIALILAPPYIICFMFLILFSGRLWRRAHCPDCREGIGIVGLETPSAAAAHQRQYLLIITNLIDEQINLSLRVLYCCELVNRENLFFTACLNNQLESILVWKIPAAQAVDRNFPLGSRLFQLRYKTVSLLSHRLVPPMIQLNRSE